MIPGLVSITFRKLSPREIAALCEETGLKAIEWGGDVHVPPTGNNAAEVRRISQDAGLEICSYGTYYRVGQPIDDFRRCLDTAKELGTKVVRIWCGQKASAECSAEERAQIVEGLNACCELAKGYDLFPSLEYHANTLTDSISSVNQLLNETAHLTNLRYYWQPWFNWPEIDVLASLPPVLPYLAHVHTYSWEYTAEGVLRHPLADGEGMWEKAIELLPEDAHLLLEFVRDDSPLALKEDAKTLIEWLKR